MRAQRAGFTLVELMITVGIIGLLSAVAIPKYHQVKARAQSTRLIGDFDVVRQAALNFYADSQYFPAETGPGETPGGLVRHLPNAFAFEKPEWTLDYENIPISLGGGETQIVGVSARTTDPRVGEVTMQIFGPGASFMYNSKLLYIISGGL